MSKNNLRSRKGTANFQGEMSTDGNFDALTGQEFGGENREA